jgi:very-short-patch-repair endonuclease
MAPRRTIEKARAMRRTMTPPEVRLWAILRSAPNGIRFRRQHPIGPYVLDFYCPRAKLAIEIDGIAHDMGDTPRRDLARDRWLAEQGIATMRIAASDVFQRLETVVENILERTAFPLHHPADGPPPHAPHREDE